MNTSTLRGALNAALRLPDDQVKAAISKILEANYRKPGRAPITGRFDTRAELEDWIWRTYHNTSATQADIARQCRVSAMVVANVLKLKPLPLPGRKLDHKGKVGLVHHAFRSRIAPSGVLVGVYRYGPHNAYLGYLDSSQVREL